MTTRRRRTKGESRARIRLRVIVRRRIRKLCINGSDDGGLALGLVLQHEAYRDGMERSGNSAETVRAVKAHTEMALRMQGSGMGGKLLGGVLSYVPELQGDIDNYYGYMYGLSQGGASKDAAEAAYAAYVDGTYDSSKDYWKVILDAHGKVARVIDDGDYDHINVFDVGGKQQRSVAYTRGESLVNAILSGAEGLPAGRRGDADWERVNRAMVTSGLDWDEKSGWYAKTDQAKADSVKAIEERNGRERSVIFSLKRIGSSITNNVKHTINMTKNRVSSFVAGLQIGTRMLNSEMVPGESLEFWDSMMDSKTMAKYDKDNNGGTPQCNNYVADSIKSQFGDVVYNKVFPDGVNTANEMFDQFTKNPNLKVIDTNKYTVDNIQAMTDKGVLIIMAFKNPNPKESGHLAFVAHSKVRMMSSPKNYKGTNLPQSGFGEEQSFKSAYPILSQAGEVTGNVTAAWGIPGWNDDSKVDDLEYRKYLLKNYVCFYTVVK